MPAAVDDPDELHALASTAMDHAIRSIPLRGALLPFGLIESEAGRQAVRAIADRLEDMHAETRRLVAEGDRPARAVIVWDGYSDFTGRRLDTVFVEAYEAGAAGGILIAQSYRSVGLVKKRTEIVGQGGVIARGRPPLF